MEKQITKFLRDLLVSSRYRSPKEISTNIKKIYFVNSYYYSPLEISYVAKKIALQVPVSRYIIAKDVKAIKVAKEGVDEVVIPIEWKEPFMYEKGKRIVNLWFLVKQITAHRFWLNIYVRLLTDENINMIISQQLVKSFSWYLNWFLIKMVVDSILHRLNCYIFFNQEYLSILQSAIASYTFLDAINILFFDYK